MNDSFGRAEYSGCQEIITFATKTIEKYSVLVHTANEFLIPDSNMNLTNF